MYRFVLSPRWLAIHTMVGVLVVVMVNLGFWQMRRLDDRREFNAEVRARSAMPVEDLEAVVTDRIDTLADARLVEWRPVRVRGTYLADEQVVVVNRSQGGVAGRNVVTPLQTAGDTVVLVNRGFVAADDAVPAPPAGTVTVVGRLRSTEKRSFGGLTDAAGGPLTELQRLDIARLAEQIPGRVAPVYVSLISSDLSAPGDPVPLPEPRLDEGSHQSYMIQWFIFSACAVGGWAVAIRRTAHRRRISAAAGRTATGSPTPADDAPATAPR